MRKLRRETKKVKLERLLREHGGRVPIDLAAKELYGRDGELEREKVIRLLSAYRADGILNCRVKNLMVTTTF
ncbi:hypothetical protein [Desulfothermobacter acidiphilus]|uniref:hypothetical protein n=1 Tax=Desulfothermobacter acidiphilus TaxID=1938353 RepID=UPI003F8A6A76